MMQVILSAPSPSDAAKFIGHILSIIISIILERIILPSASTAGGACLIVGDPPALPNVGFFVGEPILFLPAATVVYEDFNLEGESGFYCYLSILFLVSYTKSTAY